jgi:hypothetical protein
MPETVFITDVFQPANPDLAELVPVSEVARYWKAEEEFVRRAFTGARGAFCESRAPVNGALERCPGIRGSTYGHPEAKERQTKGGRADLLKSESRLSRRKLAGLSSAR